MYLKYYLKYMYFKILPITVRYDTIYLRALKSWRDGQFSLALGTETKNKEKLKTKTE